MRRLDQPEVNESLRQSYNIPRSKGRPSVAISVTSIGKSVSDFGGNVHSITFN